MLENIGLLVKAVEKMRIRLTHCKFGNASRQMAEICLGASPVRRSKKDNARGILVYHPQSLILIIVKVF